MDEKNAGNLVIYFIRYVHIKSINMLSLHYHEWKRTEEHEGKKYLIFDDYMLDKVNTKILIDTGDKLPECLHISGFLVYVRNKARVGIRAFLALLKYICIKDSCIKTWKSWQQFSSFLNLCLKLGCCK